MQYLMIAATVARSIQESQAQSTQLKAQAQAANYSAQIAERNRELTEQQTESQVQEAERQRRLRLGANIAAMGASGVAGGSGLDILSDNITQETLDILNIEREGVLRAQNYQIEAGMQRASASNYLAQRPSMASTIMKAGSRGLGQGYSTGVFK